MALFVHAALPMAALLFSGTVAVAQSTMQKPLLEDIATGQAESAFQVQRRQDLACEDRALEIGRVLVEQVEAAIGK